MKLPTLCKYSILLLLMGINNQTLAAGQWCSGKISNIHVGADGQLYIVGSWRKQHTTICNINENRRGVTPEVCKSWLSLAITAYTTEVAVTMHYGNIESCGAIPAYGSAPAPSYLMLATK